MRTPLLAALLAIPSAVYLWHNADLPQFCNFHDDCIYFVSAKSLAQGNGYRIESLPGAPSQTKHPPLYPALLAVAWKLVPEFPRNLPLAAWISWLALPPLLVLIAAYLPRIGISGCWRWMIVALFALNPYTIWFSSQLLSELWFMLLLFTALLTLEKRPLAAGGLGGLAYLTRSAGIALVPAAFLYLWLRKDRRGAWMFLAGMLPLVAAWTLWAGLERFHTTDPALLYYLDYAAYEKLNISLDTAHLYLWKNADGLLLGLGSFVLPKVTGNLFLKILAQVIAVAMISGVVRLVKQGEARLYALYATVSSALLLAWHFPPDERFVLPLVPLALCGLVIELEHFTRLLRHSLRHRDLSQRVVAAGMIATAGIVFGGALVLQAYVTLVIQPSSAAQARRDRTIERDALVWVKQNTTSGKLLAYSDPLVYLYTGRPVLRQSLLPKLWYREDHAGTVDLWGNLAEFARDHDIRYYYFVERDLGAVSEEDRESITQMHQASLEMKPVFAKGPVTIYEFLGSSAYTTPPSSTMTNPGQVVAGR